MAHTLGATGEYPTSTSTSTADPVSTTFTTQSGDTVLVLGIWYAGSANRTGGDPTFNGKALTQYYQAYRAASSPETTVELWYLLAPDIGTYTLSVPNSGAKAIKLWAASFGSATGASAYHTGAYGSNTSTNPAVSITTTVDGCAIFGIIGSGANTWAPTAQTSTAIANRDLGNYGGGAGYYLQSTAGTFGFNYTFGTSEDWAILTVAFSETSPPITGAVAISVASTLGADGTVVKAPVTGSVSMASVATFAASGVRTLAGQASMSVSSILSASGRRTTAGSASIAAAAALMVSGAYLRFGSAQITAGATISVTGGRIVAGGLAVAAQAVLTASGQVITVGYVYGAVALSIQAVLSAQGVKTTTGSAAISVHAALSAQGARITAGALAVHPASVLGIAGSRQLNGALSVQVPAVMSAVGAIMSTGSVAIPVILLLSAGGSVVSAVVGRGQLHSEVSHPHIAGSVSVPVINVSVRAPGISVAVKEKDK
jgi:hypothetical protein